MTGRLIAIVGPSGAGKDTLLDAACLADPYLVRVRRVITRPETAGGEPFCAVTDAAFDRLLTSDALAFWWQAHGLRYGIPATAVQQARAGQVVVFNGSRGALADIQRVEPMVEIVAVTAPDDVLAARLAQRGRETKDDIRRRLKRAAWGVPDSARVVVNDGTITQGAQRLLAALNPTEGSGQ